MTFIALIFDFHHVFFILFFYGFLLRMFVLFCFFFCFVNLCPSRYSPSQPLGPGRTHAIPPPPPRLEWQPRRLPRVHQKLMLCLDLNGLLRYESLLT